MYKIFIVFTITTLIESCSFRVFPENPNSQVSLQNLMFSTENILISEVTLQAREEKKLPSGANPNPNRDIGFASVFVRLENPQESNVKLTIKNVEIRNTYDNKVQIAQSSPQEIILKPLENSEEVFRLTNKTGYSKNNKVKAVITYQIGEQEEIIESKPTEIERF